MDKMCSSLLLLLILANITTLSSTPTITEILSEFPNFSKFSNFLSTAYVDFDIRFVDTPFTVLVVPNDNLHNSTTLTNNVLRYHIVLKYLTLSDLQSYPGSGILVPTLFQFFGHHDQDFGYLNINHDPTTNSVILSSQSSRATLLSQISIPYTDISLLSIDSILIPYRLEHVDIVNITDILLKRNDYIVFSSLLQASGVGWEIENDEGDTGITLFVPNDVKFFNPIFSDVFQSLSAFKKTDIIKYHVLKSYYSLGWLQKVVDPFHATLAMEDLGAGTFLLNISSVNGVLTVDTGIVKASVTKNLYDKKPLAIFGVSAVLLPKEFFGEKTM